MHLSDYSRKNQTGYWTVFIVYALAFASYGEESGGAFLLGFLLNYTFQSRSRGTWLESHHLWQMKTVKVTLKGLALCFVLMYPAFIFKDSVVFKILFYSGFPIACFVGFLFFYRFCKGLVHFIQQNPIHSKTITNRTNNRWLCSLRSLL